MKPIKLAILVASVLFTAAVAAQAQEKKMEAPKPGPEVKKLGYFVGTWKSEGELKENPFGMPPGKYAGTDNCEWFHGGFQVVCHSSAKGPAGAMHSIGIIAYNTRPEQRDGGGRPLGLHVRHEDRRQDVPRPLLHDDVVSGFVYLQVRDLRRRNELDALHGRQVHEDGGKESGAGGEEARGGKESVVRISVPNRLRGRASPRHRSAGRPRR